MGELVPLYKTISQQALGLGRAQSSALFSGLGMFRALGTRELRYGGGHETIFHS